MKHIYQIFFVIILLCLPGILFAQHSNRFQSQIPHPKLYKPSDVVDSVYGIQMYQKLNFFLGGDSVRNNLKGYACQGWVEDFYTTGKLLHKGYYVNGQLKMYANFYPDGKMEREFKRNSEVKGEMKKFYDDSASTIKSDVIYVNGNSVNWQDFFKNGQLSYIEVYNKKGILTKRNSYFQNGKPESLFTLISDKHHNYRYTLQEYYKNGQLKDEAQMHYNQDVLDYQKDGKYKAYDKNGKLTSEIEYINGEINKTIK